MARVRRTVGEPADARHDDGGVPACSSPFGLLGLYTAREEIRAHRWDPELFRTGLCLFRSAVPLSAVPAEVPMPAFRGRAFWAKNRAARLSAQEVAFFMPTLNGPVMRGLLRYNQVTSSLEVVGHLQLGVWGLFAFGFSAAGLTLALPLLAALFAWGYWGERQAFRRLLLQSAEHA